MNLSGEPRPRVLIVDDDPGTIIALRSLFHHGANWGALEASNLAEARAMLPERPDAVLLDLMLPDGSGEDLIEEIRDRLPACRIIVVTAIPEGMPRILRIAEQRAKPDCIIHKPYDIDELIATVQGDCPDPLPQ